MVYQHGSPFYDEDEDTCRAMHRKASQQLSNKQSISKIYSNMWHCVCWLLDLRSKNIKSVDRFKCGTPKERNIKTWYYTTNLHKGAFMLPRYVEDSRKKRKTNTKQEDKRWEDFNYWMRWSSKCSNS